MCAAATPPSKGEPAPLRRGETLMTKLHLNILFRLPLLIYHIIPFSDSLS